MLLFLIVLLPLDYFILVELLEVSFGLPYYFTFAYFTFIVLIIQFFINGSLKKRPGQFVWTFLGSLGIKMFLSLIILLVMIYTGVENPKVFGINFVTLYMLFSTFSVRHILKAQKASIGQDKE